MRDTVGRAASRVAALARPRPRAPEPAAIVRALADLLSGGFTLRKAIQMWAAHAPPGAAADLRSVARRLALGAPPPAAVGSATCMKGEDAAALACAIATHRENGGDLVAILRSQVASMTRRQERAAAARSAVSGVVTSGRLVAGLPLVTILLLPASDAPLFDATSVLAIASGIFLAAAGMRWMKRLVPRPAPEPAAARVADEMAALLDGGLPLSRAASVCAGNAPAGLEEDLGRTQRRAVLGGSWAEAFARSQDPGLSALGVRLQASQRLGVPAADALRSLAESARAESERDFETTTRRAPVLMVVPLVVCVLPAFCLIGLVPFMRGFSFY